MSWDAFLRCLYQHAAGNPANLVDMLVVGGEVGLSIEETKRAIELLVGEGLVEHPLRGQIALTAAGCRRVKESSPVVQGKGVFISYSRQDGRWLKRLQVHLQPLARAGLEIWDDRRLRLGDQWIQEIQRAVERAKVAVLLISADFLASDFVEHYELPLLMKAREERGLKIVPVIISRSRFEHSALAGFQSTPAPSQPLNRMSFGKQEEILAAVAEAIEGLVSENDG